MIKLISGKVILRINVDFMCTLLIYIILEYLNIKYKSALVNASLAFSLNSNFYKSLINVLNVPLLFFPSFATTDTTILTTEFHIS